MSSVGLSSVGLSSVGLSSVGLSSVGLSSVGLSSAGLSGVGLSSVGLGSAGLSSVGLRSVGCRDSLEPSVAAHLDAQLDGAAALKPRMHRRVGTANGMGHERRVFEGWRLGHRCRHRLGLWGMGMYPCECAAGPATLFIFGSRLCGAHDGNRSCTLGHKGEKRRRAIRPARKKKDARSARARLVRLGRYYLCATAAYRVDALRCLADTAGARAQRAVGGAKAHSEDGEWDLFVSEHAERRRG